MKTMKIMNHKKKIRAFIAISLSADTVLFLRKIQAEIKRKIPLAVYSRPDTIHITLKFIGDIQNDDIGKIVEIMQQTVADNDSFSLLTGGIGVFPSVKRARVVWAGIKGETDSLEKVHSDLETKFCIAGFEKEKKRFSPHITLARLKIHPDPAAVVQLLHDFKKKISPSFTCNTIDLFKSELRNSGAVHTKLFSACFRDIINP